MKNEPALNLSFKLEPFKHQRELLSRISDRDYYALFWDLGTGKTATAINLLRLKCIQEKKILKTLILSPLIVCDNWYREFEVHSNIAKHVQVLTGNSKQRTTQLLQGYHERGERIFITNHEALSMKEIYKALSDFQFDCLIIDESHKYKNPSGKRTKLVHQLADQPNCRFRYILTGTPITNSPLDIWAQMRILSPYITSDNFYAFRAKYFEDQNARMPKHIHFPNWKIRKGAEDALHKKIYKHADRVEKRDVLDLPPFIRTRVNVALTPVQARLYKGMCEDFMAFLNDAACTADLAIVKALRLQQLVSGLFKEDLTDKPKRIESNRPAVLKEVIESLPSDAQFIVWCVFKESYVQVGEVLEEMGITHSFLTGKQTYDEKNMSVEMFQNGKSRALVANQAAGGVGVNLQNATYSIYFSRNFSLEQDMQSEARNYRAGQTKKVQRIDLVTPDTIDEHILTALANKHNMSEAILKLRGKL